MPVPAFPVRLTATMLLLAAALLSPLARAADNTPWCIDQRAACVDRCSDYPDSKSITFDCIDKGSTSSVQRVVVCTCLDASGKQLGSFNWGAAGASAATSPGDRSRTSTAVAQSSG
jgi:hypothetical protein